MSKCFFPNCSCVAGFPAVECVISDKTSVQIQFDDDPNKKTADLRDYTIFTNETYDLPKDLFRSSSSIKMSIMLSGLKSLEASVCNYQLAYLNVDHVISLKTVDPELLHECIALKMLRISRSQVQNVTFIPNQRMCKLENLILVNNKIHTVSSHITRWCRELSNIDLSGNQISQLPTQFFVTCGSLLTLSLSHNHITELEPQVFDKCDKLDDLDLSQNFLRSLVNVVPTTNSKVRFLNLELNQLQEVPHRVFSTSKNLAELNLNFNNISQISSEIFDVCDNLRLLKLKGNSLTSFSINVIENCSRIYTLELSDNRIESLSTHSLLPSLRYLGLANNKLQNLPLNWLQTQILLLNGNQLVNLPDNLLTSSNLIQIDLSTNQLQSIPPSSRGSCLHKLDVSNNQLKLFNLNSNPSTFYNLSHNKISVLTADSINRKCITTILDASNNEIKELKPGWSIGLQNLLTLDLSYNQVKQLSSKHLFLLDNLRHLNLAHNKLTYIEDGVFNSMLQMVNLNLMDNPIHTYDANFIPVMNFCSDNVELIPLLLQKSITDATCQRPGNCKCQQMKSLLTDVECSDKVICESTDCPQLCSCGKVNNVTFVDCGDANMSSAPMMLPRNTWVVYMENNQIDPILGFNHSSWMSVVYLYMKNSLVKDRKDLSGLPFINLKNTKELDLSQNLILSIQSGVFKGLERLRRLDLSGNEISDLSSELFVDISNVEILDLSDNKLTLLNFWFGLTQLKHVILENNQITRISENNYQLSSSLLSLNLKHNMISSLEFLFHHNSALPSNLTSVDLSHNRFKELNISMNNFDKSYLKLYFQNNLIQKVNIFNSNDSNSSGILELFLEKNDLLCDCHLGSLITSLNSQNSSFYLVIDRAVCQRPIFLKNRNIASLDSSDLLCPQLSCPDGCKCYKNYSTDGIQMDCSVDDSKLVQLPLKAPPQIHSLYIRNLSSVTTLSDPSWNTLKEFYLIDRDTAKSDFKALKNFSRIEKVEIDEHCWCRVRNYVASSLNPITGSCDQSLPSSHCIRDPTNNKIWSRVECTSSFTPETSFSKIPICPVYDDCGVCNCYLDSSLSLVMNCSNKEMTHFPPNQTLKNVKILDMNFNFLTILPDLSQFSQLEELYVKNNLIQRIAGDILPTLRLVELDNNLITVPSGWLDEIAKEVMSDVYVRVSLLGNPLQCDCDLPNFSQWPLNRITAILIKANQTICFKKDQTRLLMQSVQCTKSRVGLIVGISMVLSILTIIAVLVALYFKFHHSINVFMLTHDICLCLLKEESFDDDREYAFDAFLSYSSEDSEIIVNDLLPGLEKADFKVCVHERDWLGGQFISEQIVISVHTSRRTIIVLSESFLRSPWATMEFKVALQQALEDRVNRIIIVVPGKLPSKDQMDPDLRSFVTMNTYLFLSDSRFWDKLMFAMPRKTKGKVPLRKLPQDFVELMKIDSSKRMSDAGTVSTEVYEDDSGLDVGQLGELRLHN
uniref:TIR domain-containing protein n=1 Tax=Strigamia maritima TaxID=126957 RepID=T1J4L4_STRMM